MTDLENLLLEAAGRTSSAGRNQHSVPSSRRRCEGLYSDGGSDSRDDDSSDDNRGNERRKPSSSQVPLQKRSDPNERDENQGSQEERDYDGRADHGGDSSDEFDVGSDLYLDEDDRLKLAQMTELEREMILSGRASNLYDKAFVESLRSKRETESTSHSRKVSPPHSAPVRSSAKFSDRAAAKDDALNELRAKRMKQQDPEAHPTLRNASRGCSRSRDLMNNKRKFFSASALSSSSESDIESKLPSEDDGTVDSDDDVTVDGSPTFDDIKDITIRRSKLAKWFMEPFFEELIVGCYVRVGIGRSRTGPIYRLCLVRNVDASDPNRLYKLESKMTYKYLNVIWDSESSAARWQMAMISDSPPLEEEYRQLLKEVERRGGRMPKKQDLLGKKEAIQKINSFVYSAATVKQMLQERKSAVSRPLNIAAEKEKLRRLMDVALSKNDEEEVESIKMQLQELEAARHSQEKDAKALKLAEMNRKNRVENFKNASELRHVHAVLRAGEAGYDPLSRRWTRSRNYYAANPGGSEEPAETNASTNGVLAAAGSNGSGVTVMTESGMKATAAALEAAAGARKLVDTKAPVDQVIESNMLHDFNLPISLAVLEKFGGPKGAQAGFISRKQMIEATVGVRAPVNDGRRHALTLTVSDYKRRRGLL